MEKRHLPYSNGQWLHLDYSPPLSSGQVMYQSTVYLFPSRISAAWQRIGLMTSMAPKSWQQDGAASALLAGAIIGAAGKSPAGVRFGHLQKIAEGYGTPGMSTLKPQL